MVAGIPVTAQIEELVKSEGSEKYYFE